MKACSVCGRACTSSRCKRHELAPVGAAYLKARKQVLREEHLCWICGKPATENDPLSADHLIPRSAGGPDTRNNLRAAHLSCNKKRGVDNTYPKPSTDTRIVWPRG